MSHRILGDEVHFYLSAEKWDAFCAALDAPPKELPKLRELLRKPSIFDESRETSGFSEGP